MKMTLFGSLVTVAVSVVLRFADPLTGGILMQFPKKSRLRRPEAGLFAAG